MDHLLLVSIVDCVTDRAKEFQTLADVQLMSVAITVERLPFNKLHHEVRQSVFGCAAVEQARDVWMIESSEYLAFFAETTQDEVSIHAALHEFDGGTFVELVKRGMDTDFILRR